MDRLGHYSLFGQKPGWIHHRQRIVGHIAVAVVALSIGLVGDVRIRRQHPARHGVLNAPIHVIHAHPETELRLECIALARSAGRGGGRVVHFLRTAPGSGYSPLATNAASMAAAAVSAIRSSTIIVPIILFAVLS